MGTRLARRNHQPGSREPVSAATRQHAGPADAKLGIVAAEGLFRVRCPPPVWPWPCPPPGLSDILSSTTAVGPRQQWIGAARARCRHISRIHAAYERRKPLSTLSFWPGGLSASAQVTQGKKDLQLLRWSAPVIKVTPCCAVCAKVRARIRTSLSSSPVALVGCVHLSVRRNLCPVIAACWSRKSCCQSSGWRAKKGGSC